VIDSARVVAYAFVHDIPYRRWGRIFAGDVLVEAVPQLAIVVNLGKNIGPMLFHCDADWRPLGTSGGDTIEQIKERAEQNYPGVHARWVDTDTTHADALAYFDATTDEPRCSFCGKRAFEVTGMVGTSDVAICAECVQEFHEALGEKVEH
jgi:hypothetical protein